jgi:vesicle coat complex subunit
MLVLTICASAFGCGKEKATSDLVADLKSPEEKERLVAVRLLPGRTEDAAEAVPALIGALKDRHAEVRRSAALGLGNFGLAAKEAIPALETARNDRDARVREAARIALSRIDPARFRGK